MNTTILHSLSDFDSIYGRQVKQNEDTVAVAFVGYTTLPKPQLCFEIKLRVEKSCPELNDLIHRQTRLSVQKATAGDDIIFNRVDGADYLVFQVSESAAGAAPSIPKVLHFEEQIWNCHRVHCKSMSDTVLASLTFLVEEGVFDAVTELCITDSPSVATSPNIIENLASLKKIMMHKCASFVSIPEVLRKLPIVWEVSECPSYQEVTPEAPLAPDSIDGLLTDVGFTHATAVRENLRLHGLAPGHADLLAHHAFQSIHFELGTLAEELHLLEGFMANYYQSILQHVATDPTSCLCLGSPEFLSGSSISASSVACALFSGNYSVIGKHHTPVRVHADY